MQRPPGAGTTGDPFLHQRGQCAKGFVRGKLLQEAGRRGGDLFLTALLDDLLGNEAVIQVGIAGYLALEGQRQIRHIVICRRQQEPHSVRIRNVYCFLTGSAVNVFRKVHIIGKHQGHHPDSHIAKPPGRRNEKIVRVFCQWSSKRKYSSGR